MTDFLVILRKDKDMIIRKAEEKDLDQVLALLSDLLELHAKLRPDIFIPGTTKYTKEELLDIFSNDETPVFLAMNDDDEEMMGYVFCIIREQPFTTNMIQFETLFIDDFGVVEKFRGQHIATKMFEFIKEEAKRRGCYDVTLNVWEGNDKARKFYDSMGMKVKETQLELILDD